MGERKTSKIIALFISQSRMEMDSNEKLKQSKNFTQQTLFYLPIFAVTAVDVVVKFTTFSMKVVNYRNYIEHRMFN